MNQSGCDSFRHQRAMVAEWVRRQLLSDGLNDLLGTNCGAERHAGGAEKNHPVRFLAGLQEAH